MKILCLGDVVGKVGRRAIFHLLPKLKEQYKIEFFIANAENAAGGAGLTPKIAKELFRYGCHVLTLGDHCWDRPDLVDHLKDNQKILRPANFPEGVPGAGWGIFETVKGQKIGVIVLLGRVFLRHHADCPFRFFNGIIEQMRKETKIIVVDFHAEATSEKIAFGYFADSRASVIFGTHTHVQTADERILSGGTAYITDLGMTGPMDSVIGQTKEKIVERFVTGMPKRFEVAKKNPWLNGIVVDIDEQTGLSKTIKRIQLPCDIQSNQDTEESE